MKTGQSLTDILQRHNMTLSISNLHGWKLEVLEKLALQGIECVVQSWSEEDDPASPIEETYCNTTWDGTYCWPRTLAGESLSRTCSDIFGNRTVRPRGEITRLCTENGTWEDEAWEDYSLCHRARRPRSRKLVALVLFLGSCISLLSLIIALSIFTHFRNLRCDRVKLHVHFMIALALKCITFIIISEPPLFGRTTHFYKISWFCKLVTALQLYTSVASINWMFVQGHYLNSKLTSQVFGKRYSLRWYIIFGWGVSFATICTWCVAMEQYNAAQCWLGYTESNLIWILLGPLLTVLLANLLFLGNTLRVLLWKINLTSNDTEGQQIRRALRATVILFPLLGMNILIFFYNPGGAFLPYYMVINAFLHSSQGMFVSIFYCFLGREVKDSIRRQYLMTFNRKRYRSGNKSEPRNKSRSSGSHNNTFSIEHEAVPQKLRPEHISDSLVRYFVDGNRVEVQQLDECDPLEGMIVCSHL